MEDFRKNGHTCVENIYNFTLQYHVKQQNRLTMFKFDLDERGYLKKRESSDLEYKQNFHRGDETLKYIKTLIGMANNKGGSIMFGVKDSPHVPLGMTNPKFTELDPKDFDNQMRQFFSPAIEWTMTTETYEGKLFGLMTVKEADTKPILCSRSKTTILREGAIYFRYRGETKEIEYPELRKLLETEKEKERILWISHIQKIAKIGPSNVELLDVYKGQLTVDEHKILIDKTLIDKIKFIREGHFVESYEEGLPALKLMGDVKGVDLAGAAAINPNDVYIYTTKQLQDKLGINQYEMQSIILALQIKGKKKWHLSIPNGKGVVHKYTDALLKVLQRKLAASEFLPSCLNAYKERQKSIRLVKKK